MENYKIVAVYDWNDQNDDYIYHYTNISNALNILNEKVLRTTQARIPRFGRGVFMTKCPPNLSDNELIQNNYQGNRKYVSKVKCAFAFERAYLNAHQLLVYNDSNRDLWRYDYDIYLYNKEFTLILRKKKDFYLIRIQSTQTKPKQFLTQRLIQSHTTELPRKNLLPHEKEKKDNKINTWNITQGILKLINYPINILRKFILAPIFKVSRTFFNLINTNLFYTFLFFFSLIIFKKFNFNIYKIYAKIIKYSLI